MDREEMINAEDYDTLLKEEADFVSYIVIRIRTESADRNGKPIRPCQKQRSARKKSSIVRISDK